MSEALNSPEAKSRRFRPYPKYKDSGVEWLGDIPAHWKVYPFKRLFSTIYRYPTYFGIEYVNEGVKEIRGEALGVDGRIIELEDQRYIPHELSERFYRTILEEGDLVMSVRGTMGKIAYVDKTFVGSNITANLLRLSPRRDLVNGQYLVKVISSTYFDRQLDRQAPQTTIKTITMPQLAVIPIALPPKAEQLITASFLDRETAKIDALIEKNRRLIELLQEKRTALITQAVTKGLDPTVPMKDSGIEWIGEIPEHWQARRIAIVAAKITNGYVGPTRDIFVNEGIRYLQSLHIKNGLIDFERHPYFVTADWSHEHKKSILAEGDILVVQTGGIGQVAVVPKEFVGCNCHALIIIRLKRGLGVGAWIARSLESDYGQQALGWSQTGALHPHLECGFLREIRIALPPPDEQTRILKDLEILLAKHDALSAKIQEAIARLKEYRSALISEAVTGKVDLRSFG